MMLTIKEDIEKIRGYYLFVPVHGIKLIDLDAILPVIENYQDTTSQTLLNARTGASLSAIKNKEMCIVKKDNNGI